MGSLEGIGGYLRMRDAWRAVPILIAVAAAIIVIGEVQVPNLVGGVGAPAFPLWRFLVMISALIPAVVNDSPAINLEGAAGRGYRWTAAATLLAMIALNVGGLVALVGWRFEPEVCAVILRGAAGWCGLALISGRVFGWPRSWVLPVGALVVLSYWGTSSVTTYEWWEFTARPAGDAPASFVAWGLFAVGLGMALADRWTVSLLRRGRILRRE